jgi:hypothetical protein
MWDEDDILIDHKDALKTLKLLLTIKNMGIVSEGSLETLIKLSPSHWLPLRSEYNNHLFQLNYEAMHRLFNP